MPSKIELFLLTFSCYVSIHALRTSYSFSKHYLDQTLHVSKSAISFVDSVLLTTLGIGHFLHALYPVKNPVKTLWIGTIFCALDYALVPYLIETCHIHNYWILFGLMAINGFLQSYTWPNLLMVIQSQFDPNRQSTLLGFWATNTNFGNILGYFLCYQLISVHHYHWEFGMYTTALFVCINGILIGLRVDEIQRPKSSNNTQQLSLVQKKELQQHTKMSKVFNDPMVLLLTIAFSLIKSVIYGIMLWLPLYFHNIGLQQYKTKIPITYDVASIIGSLLLGYAFKRVTHKGPLLAPLMLILVVLFVCLRYLQLQVSGYFILIAGVGACLGGSFNTMAGLITMQLAKIVPKQFQNQCLGFFSALTMAFANLTTAVTQILIGYVAQKDESMIFVIFLGYSFVALIVFLVLMIKQFKQSKIAKLRSDKISRYQRVLKNWFEKSTIQSLAKQKEEAHHQNENHKKKAD